MAFKPGLSIRQKVTYRVAIRYRVFVWNAWETCPLTPTLTTDDPEQVRTWLRNLRAAGKCTQVIEVPDTDRKREVVAIPEDNSAIRTKAATARGTAQAKQPTIRRKG